MAEGQSHGHGHGLNEKKLESPTRVKELDPEGTLERIGLRAGQTFCDIGAGTGLFAAAAARMAAQVYALDVDPEAVEYVRKRAERERLGNVESLLSDGAAYPLPEDSVDAALMCTVLHEIPESDRPAVLGEVRRILVPRGTFAIIEFKVQEHIEFGPPASERIPRDVIVALCEAAGLSAAGEFDMSHNLYCLLFAPALLGSNH